MCLQGISLKENNIHGWIKYKISLCMEGLGISLSIRAILRKNYLDPMWIGISQYDIYQMDIALRNH